MNSSTPQQQVELMNCANRKLMNDRRRLFMKFSKIEGRSVPLLPGAGSPSSAQPGYTRHSKLYTTHLYIIDRHFKHIESRLKLFIFLYQEFNNDSKNIWDIPRQGYM